MRAVTGCAVRLLYSCRRRPLVCFVCTLLVGWIVLVNRSIELRDLASHSRREDVASFGECPVDAASRNVICIAFATQAFGGYSYWEQILQRDRAPGCSADCRLVSDPARAHGLLFHAFDLPSRRQLRHLRRVSPAEQLWIYYSLESPVHLATNRCIWDCKYGWQLDSALAYLKEFFYPSYLLRPYPPETTEEAGFFNWTITYRRDSTIYSPYGRLTKRPETGAALSAPASVSSTVPSASKRHLSFIVVSNCHPYNKRMAVLAQLRKHMEVHIYGSCGDRTFSTNITELSKLYYFHLSFENAYCRDYITEKFFANGLDGFAVPVVFGGFSRSDYEAVAPPNSFLYAGDFKSPATLAKRLKHLVANPKEYQAYHRWKQTYGGVDTGGSQLNIFCQLCSKLKQSYGSRGQAILDLNRFYSSGSQCRSADFDPFTGDL